MKSTKERFLKGVSLFMAGILVFSGIIPGSAAGEAKAMETRGTAQIIADYNSSIGTSSPYLFGGAGKLPGKEDAKAWETLQKDFGLKVEKVQIDLKALFPTDENTMDSDVLNDYAHVAGSVLSRINGAGMQAMLEFVNLPAWLDANGDKKYDNLVAYQKIIEKAYTEIKNTWSAENPDLIAFVEITPEHSLSAADFSEVYFKTAEKIRALDGKVAIGGPGYQLTGPGDNFNNQVISLLNQYRDSTDKTLLQFISVRAYGIETGKDTFGEFKNGRKVIRNQSGNADLPLFMTGWTTSLKDAATADGKITGVDGIKYHAESLFKAMRDGWDLVLFDSMASDKQNPASYAFTQDGAGNIARMPFAKTYQLFNCLGLNQGEFKVISTDMGSSWVVDDSIAMMNANKDAVMFLSNFGGAKTNVTVEMRNVPFQDGQVQVKTYVAADGQEPPSIEKPLHTISAEVVNGNLNLTIPAIPVGAMGVIVSGENRRELEAQSMYEFESQDNHFGGNTEITWTTGASFNRTVQGFGGENNFVTLQKVSADGAGTYTAKLYINSPNEHVMISVNGQTAFAINAGSSDLNTPAEFDVNLEAGNNNTIKVYTASGELKPDRLVLTAKDIQLSVGFQNLTELEKEEAEGITKYVLPLAKTDFTVDARIFPANAADGKTIEFSSSDESCARIDANTGRITPLKEGETTITAAVSTPAAIQAVSGQAVDAKAGEVKNSFILKIKNTISSVSVEPKQLELIKGKEATITAAVLPENVSNRNVEWTITGEGLEIVEKDGEKIKVRAVGETGMATVTARTVEGGLSDSCLVTINKVEAGGSITADFGSTIATGHPEIFGMTHYPNSNPSDGDIGDHAQVWNMLKESGGVRFVRADARLQEILPIWTKKEDTNWAKPAAGTFDPSKQPNYVISELYYVTGPDGIDRQFTVEGYKEDMEYYAEHGKYLNGFSNPENWNTDRLLRWVRKAKQTGLKVMVMTFQIPEWLAGGYPLPGAPHTEKACNSAPKDWTIYRDIVKKVYKMLKEEGVDYYEFLNEPHWYVPKGGDQRDPQGKAYEGSGADFANAVAADQFYQAIDAIYEYERETSNNPQARPQMLLGGGSDDSWGGGYGVLGTILSDKYKEYIDRIDFISIHKYGERPANQDNSNDGGNARNLKFWLKEKTGKDIRLFLNEYNISTGQPTDETYGTKSLGWHTKNLIDMMADEFSGGGYYTCYPADVPMDDYEASSGWVERGKGMYTWNDGKPYLATFTKAWDLMSNKMGLGAGEFLVKSTDVTKSSMTQGAAALNQEGNPVVILNNYQTKTFGATNITLYNLPYAENTKITASIYERTSGTPEDQSPSVKEITVGPDGKAQITLESVPSYGVVGILLKGVSTAKNDRTYEMESYLNQRSGAAKIQVNDTASNGRWLALTAGAEHSVTLPVTVTADGEKEMAVSYLASSPAKLHYKVNEASEKSIDVNGSGKMETVSIKEQLKKGTNQITFYLSGADAGLDKLVMISEDKPSDDNTGGNDNNNSGGSVPAPSKPEEQVKPGIPEKAESIKTELSSKAASGVEREDGFFYDAEGRKLTDTIVRTDKGRYILNAKGEKYVSAIVTVKNSNSYITDQTGAVIRGRMIKTNGVWYYTTKDTGKVVKDKIFKFSGSKYIANEDGTLATGRIMTVGGKKYYTTKTTGRIVQDKLFKLKGSRYIADKTGALKVSTWVTIGNKKYYCDKSGIVTKEKKK